MLFAATSSQAATVIWDGTLATSCSLYVTQQGALQYNTAEVFSTMGTPAQFQVSQNSPSAYYVRLDYPTLISSPVGASVNLDMQPMPAAGPNSASTWTDVTTHWELPLPNSGTDQVPVQLYIISQSGPLPQGYYNAEATVSCIAI